MREGASIRGPEAQAEATPLQGLMALAKEVVATAPAVRKEASSEMEALAFEELEAREHEALQIGRHEYLASIGNVQQLDKEGAAGIFDRRYRGTSIHIGHFNDSWDFKRQVQTPQDVLEALGQAMANVEDALSTDSEPVDIDTFYRNKADTMLFTVRKDTEANLNRQKFTQPRIVCVRDLPKEIAWKLYSQNVVGPTTGRVHWQELKAGIEKNFEGFTAAAVEQGDYETAIKGYKRTGRLQTPEVIDKIRSEMEKLRASDKPEDQQKLRRISQQILGF